MLSDWEDGISVLSSCTSIVNRSCTPCISSMFHYCKLITFKFIRFGSFLLFIWINLVYQDSCSVGEVDRLLVPLSLKKVVTSFLDRT